MPKSVYFISGLGADERIFKHLQLDSYSVKHIRWLRPEPDEDIVHYSRRMASGITDPNPVIVGLSFGGMIGIEIARFMPVSKLILISSIKTYKELPLWMKTLGVCKVEKLLPQKSITTYRLAKAFRPVQNYFLGAETSEEKGLANEYRDNVDPVYLKWSLHNIFHWRNDWLPTELYHIHGSKDHIFPIKYLKPTHIIPGGGHFMVMNHSKEISDIINTVIES